MNFDQQAARYQIFRVLHDIRERYLLLKALITLTHHYQYK